MTQDQNSNESTIDNVEKIFDNIAKEQMVEYDPEGFKRNFPTLHKTIIKAMCACSKMGHTLPFQNIKEAIEHQDALWDDVGEIIIDGYVSVLKKELVLANLRSTYIISHK